MAFDTTFENDIKNNFIGTNKAGEVAIPNERHGIRLLNTINNNIGDVKDTSGLGNLISGNKLSGIRIEGADRLQISWSITPSVPTLDATRRCETKSTVFTS